MPAPADAKNVCVTAVNVGSTGTNKTTCKDIDNVREFSANSLDYNVALAKLKAAKLVELDRVDHENGTSVQQSTSIAGSKTTTDTHTWTTSVGAKVTVKTKVGIPFIGESEVTVEGSFTYTDTETFTTTKVFSWSQPVIVPAHKRVVGTVSITETDAGGPVHRRRRLRLRQRPPHRGPRERHVRRYRRPRPAGPPPGVQSRRLPVGEAGSAGAGAAAPAELTRDRGPLHTRCGGPRCEIS